MRLKITHYYKYQLHIFTLAPGVTCCNLYPCVRHSARTGVRRLTGVQNGWPGLNVYSSSSFFWFKQTHYCLCCEDTRRFANLWTAEYRVITGTSVLCNKYITPPPLDNSLVGLKSERFNITCGLKGTKSPQLYIQLVTSMHWYFRQL